MKALRWSGRRDLRYVDAPEPAPGPGQLKSKAKLAGIYGTDLKEYAFGPVMILQDKVPLTVGHEFVGEVAAIFTWTKAVPLSPCWPMGGWILHP